MDSSRRRKRRPASGGHCPCRITSVPAQRTDPTILLDLPSGPTSPLTSTESQCNSDTTEECAHEQSRPFKVQRTSPTVPLSTPSSSTSPLPLTESEPSASITGPRAPARYFLDICPGWPQCTFVSRSHQSWARSLGTSGCRPLPLIGGEAHDLADPNVVDHVFLREHHHAAIST